MTTPLPTFRDPAGSLVITAEMAVRTIDPSARQSTLDLLASPFFGRLLLRGDIIATTVDDSTSTLRLLHPLIPVPTYPWEWTPAQWLAAANLTLTLAAEAIQSGYTLKDATPLNILFLGPRPVLVDVLSFEARDPAGRIWLAYAQYTRTFLLPLLMNRLLSWPLTLALFYRDGLEPTDCYRALSWPQRLSPAAFSPITLPTWLESRKPVASSAGAASGQSDPELTAHILTRTLNALRSRTEAAVPAPSSSEWSTYTGTLTHYTAEQSEAKRQWVRTALEELRPANSPLRVLDIGANTGEYSLLAASTGASVIALERDSAAADRLFRSTRDQPRIQTIHADFARPTPAAGWRNAESLALLPRLAGKADLILMLAVIHHLILMEQIPLPAILDLVYSLAARHLLIEWVPVTDPMFQSLLRGRESLYAHLTLDTLLAAATAARFTLLRQHTLSNKRTLLLFERA